MGNTPAVRSIIFSRSPEIEHKSSLASGGLRTEYHNRIPFQCFRARTGSKTVKMNPASTERVWLLVINGYRIEGSLHRGGQPANSSGHRGQRPRQQGAGHSTVHARGHGRTLAGGEERHHAAGRRGTAAVVRRTVPVNCGRRAAAGTIRRENTGS